MSGELRLQRLQGYRSDNDADVDARINFYTSSWGATLEWGANRPRISWKDTGGYLWTGYANTAEAVVKWERSDVNDSSTGHVLYYGAITQAKDLVNKEYVDNNSGAQVLNDLDDVNVGNQDEIQRAVYTLMPYNTSSVMCNQPGKAVVENNILVLALTDNTGTDFASKYNEYKIGDTIWYKTGSFVEEVVITNRWYQAAQCRFYVQAGLSIISQISPGSTIEVYFEEPPVSLEDGNYLTYSEAEKAWVPSSAIQSVITATLPLHASIELKKESYSNQVTTNYFYTCKNDDVTTSTYSQVFMPKSKIRSLMKNIPASATKLLCFDFSGTWFSLNSAVDYSRVSNRGVEKTINGVNGVLVDLANSVSSSKLSFIINLPNAVLAEFRPSDHLGSL